MGDPRGFLTHGATNFRSRPVPERLNDWNEVYEDFPNPTSGTQASRCMDCGIPFCHNGCPLGNMIPTGTTWCTGTTGERRHRIACTRPTTSRSSPAGCAPHPVRRPAWPGLDQPSGRSGHHQEHRARRSSSKAFDGGWVEAGSSPRTPTGKKVAVVGSGPAGLAAAQQLTRAGHAVTVFERADRVGGLLRYGIPEFKIEKKFHGSPARAQMEAEGTRFVTGAYVGGPQDDPSSVSAERLATDHDAVVLAGGATNWRDLPIPGPRARRHPPGHGVSCLRPTRCSWVISTLRRFRPRARGSSSSAAVTPEPTASGRAHRQGRKPASTTSRSCSASPPEDSHRRRRRGRLHPLPFRDPAHVHVARGRRGSGLGHLVTTENFVGARREGRPKSPRSSACASARRTRPRGAARWSPCPAASSSIDAELVLLAMGFLGPVQDGSAHASSPSP